MTLTPAHLCLLLGLAGVVSLASCLVYTVFRVLENRSALLNIIVVCAMTSFTSLLLVFTLLFFALGSPEFVVTFVLLLVCSLVGGWLHRTSGGRSRNLLAAFCLMCIVAEMTYVVSVGLVHASASVTPLFSPLNSATSVNRSVNWSLVLLVLCATVPTLVTAFWRVVRGLELRPGWDRHFAPEEGGRS